MTRAERYRTRAAALRAKYLKDKEKLERDTQRLERSLSPAGLAFLKTMPTVDDLIGPTPKLTDWWPK